MEIPAAPTRRAAPGEPGRPAPGEPGRPAPGEPGRPTAGEPGRPAPGEPAQPAPGGPGQPAQSELGRPAALIVWTELCEAVDRGRLSVNRALQREAGLTLAENLVLCQVAMAPGGQLQMVALARVLGVGKSAVTKTVDRLEERGWLRRQRDSQDRRAVRAALTPAGAEAFARAQPVYVAAVRAFLTGPPGAPDLRQLHRLLGQFVTAGE